MNKKQTIINALALAGACISGTVFTYCQASRALGEAAERSTKVREESLKVLREEINASHMTLRDQFDRSSAHSYYTWAKTDPKVQSCQKKLEACLDTAQTTLDCEKPNSISAVLCAPAHKWVQPCWDIHRADYFECKTEQSLDNADCLRAHAYCVQN